MGIFSELFVEKMVLQKENIVLGISKKEAGIIAKAEPKFSTVLT